MAWHAVAQNKENDSAVATANGARAKLSQSLQDDFDVAGTMGTLVTVNPALTNSEASQWFDIDGGTARHPDILGIGYIENVAPDQLESFAADVKVDPPFGVSSPDGFELTPPGQRSHYCLLRIGIFKFHTPATQNGSLQQALAAMSTFLDPGVDECVATRAQWGIQTAASAGVATVGSLNNVVARSGAAQRQQPPPRRRSSGPWSRSSRAFPSTPPAWCPQRQQAGRQTCGAG